MAKATTHAEGAEVYFSSSLSTSPSSSSTTAAAAAAAAKAAIVTTAAAAGTTTNTRSGSNNKNNKKYQKKQQQQQQQQRIPAPPTPKLTRDGLLVERPRRGDRPIEVPSLLPQPVLRPIHVVQDGADDLQELVDLGVGLGPGINWGGNNITRQFPLYTEKNRVLIMKMDFFLPENRLF